MDKSLEERVEIVNSIIFNQVMMLMTKPIKYVKNKMVGDACIGIRIGINNLSYRGIWMSTLEDIKISVDGKEISRGKMYFKLDGNTYPVSALEAHTEIFWGIESEAEVIIYEAGGLAAGKHIVEVEIFKRPDFGHSFGEGTEGYKDAFEFNHPDDIKDSLEITIKKER